MKVKASDIAAVIRSGHWEQCVLTHPFHQGRDVPDEKYTEDLLITRLFILILSSST